MIEELVFWKQSPDCSVWPWDIHTALCNDEQHDGLLELQAATIIDRIQDALSAVNTLPRPCSGRHRRPAVSGCTGLRCILHSGCFGYTNITRTT